MPSFRHGVARKRACHAKFGMENTGTEFSGGPLGCRSGRKLGTEKDMPRGASKACQVFEGFGLPKGKRCAKKCAPTPDLLARGLSMPTRPLPCVFFGVERTTWHGKKCARRVNQAVCQVLGLLHGLLGVLLACFLACFLPVVAAPPLKRLNRCTNEGNQGVTAISVSVPLGGRPPLHLLREPSVFSAFW